MTLKDFAYKLPKELIAAYPLKERTSARLLRVDKKTGQTTHHIFREIPSFFNEGDVLVLNNTKVTPARIFGQKPTGGKVEALLLKKIGSSKWKALLRPGSRVKKGTLLYFGENGVRVSGKVLDDPHSDSGEREIRFVVGARSPRPEGGATPPLQKILNRIGHMPLPPYIHRPDTETDRKDYQTVFAKKAGAVAAPTAGLHFDHALLKKLREKGVEIVEVTLHVSYGTFRPVTTEDFSKHRMLEEEFEVTSAVAKTIRRARREGRRIFACGTTVARTLETIGARHRCLAPMRGKTRLFIYPPYKFKLVDGLITNFHLPRTTLLLLVAAFLENKVGARSPRPEGGETPPLRLLNIYREAIQERYRFYSYGDAMAIL